MITLQELNPHHYPTSVEIDQNLNVLLYKVNQIAKQYSGDFSATSGLRTLADQMRINPSAPHSKHLVGAAVDIGDPEGRLKVWINDNIKQIEIADLYLESFRWTPTWVHFQCIPPLSGHRIFIP